MFCSRPTACPRRSPPSYRRPPTAWPCFYGVDTPDKDKLLASQMDVSEMRDYLGVDSLKFISLDGLYRAVGEAKGRDKGCPQYCDACFSGEIPIPVSFTEKCKHTCSSV